MKNLKVNKEARKCLDKLFANITESDYARQVHSGAEFCVQWVSFMKTADPTANYKINT